MMMNLKRGDSNHTINNNILQNDQEINLTANELLKRNKPVRRGNRFNNDTMNVNIIKSNNDVTVNNAKLMKNNNNNKDDEQSLSKKQLTSGRPANASTFTFKAPKWIDDNSPCTSPMKKNEPPLSTSRCTNTNIDTNTTSDQLMKQLFGDDDDEYDD